MKTSFLFAVGIVLGFGIATRVPEQETISIKNSFNRECWSKWSEPIDTSSRGWFRENGIVQQRTNLNTGLIEVRSVQ